MVKLFLLLLLSLLCSSSHLHHHQQFPISFVESTPSTETCASATSPTSFCVHGPCITFDGTVTSTATPFNYSLCNCNSNNGQTSLGYWILNFTAVEYNQLSTFQNGTFSLPSIYSCGECQPGYFGTGCQQACPGTLSVTTSCSGHGLCSSGLWGSGNCTCQSDSDNGFWTGTACDQCQKDYYGSDCKGKCTCNKNYGACDEGVNGTGICQCFTSTLGTGGVTCDSCADGYFSKYDTNLTCVACPVNPTTNIPCSSPLNGRCIRNPYEPSPFNSTSPSWAYSGICFCNAGFSGTSCETTCSPASSCPALCGGYPCRSCSPSPTCGAPINGICNNRTGICKCRDGFSGPDCASTFCPVGTSNGKICSGHGICNQVNGSCSCFEDPFKNGMWNGTSCSVCHSNYSGSESDGCKTKCPWSLNLVAMDGTSDLCSGRGKCFQPGNCSCTLDPANYCGGACQNTTPSCLPCSSGTYGKDCELTCACLHGGVCDDGRNGNGSCSNCQIGYVGKYCEISCLGSIPGVSVCSGHGTCSSYDGKCTCFANYSSSDCSRPCDSDNFAANGACSGHGFCDWGAAGTGKCTKCIAGYVAPSTNCANFCQCKELVANSSRYGGTCNVDGTCKCDLRFKTSTCEQCASGWSGDFCEIPCINGVTSYSIVSGVSKRLSTCNTNYGGIRCDIKCPMGNALVTPALACHAASSQGFCFEGVSGNGTCGCAAGWGGLSCNCNISKCKDLIGKHSSCDPHQEDACVCDWNWDLDAISVSSSTPTTTSTGATSGTTSSTSSSTTTITLLSDTSTTQNASTTPLPTTITTMPTISTTTTIPAPSSPSTTKPYCSICNASNSWGADCGQRCPCASGNGKCDIVTGACSCYADRVRGFWTGTLCRTCADGYTGAKCDAPLVPTLPQLPSLPGAVPRYLNSKSSINEHLLQLYEVQKTSVDLRPFLPFGQPASAILGVTNRAIFQYVTGEEYVPTSNVQRLSLAVATLCQKQYTVAAAAGDPDSDVGIILGALWVSDKKVFTLRKCITQQNVTFFNATLNQNVTVKTKKAGPWGFGSVPVHQSWAPNPATGYAVGSVESPPFSSSTTFSAFPPQYENCSLAYEEVGKTILSSPSAFNTGKYSLFARRFDNTPHLCMICQHDDVTDPNVNKASQFYSKTILEQGLYEKRLKVLVCFQFDQGLDGNVKLLMPESAKLPLFLSPVETVESMYYDDYLQKLVVFGARSDGNCIAFSMTVARFVPTGNYEVLFQPGDIDLNYLEQQRTATGGGLYTNVDLRCKNIDSVLQLKGYNSEVFDMTAIAFVSDSQGVASTSTTSPNSNNNKLHEIRHQARVILCNFSTFLPSTINAVNAYKKAVANNEIIRNSTYVAWFAWAQNVTAKNCVFPQNEPSSALDYTKITTMSFDPGLKTLFASYGSFSSTSEPPPVGSFSSIVLKRYLVDPYYTSKATDKATSSSTQLSSTTSCTTSGCSTSTSRTAYNFNYVSPIRLDGVQTTRYKGSLGHWTSVAGVFSRILYLGELGVDGVLNRQLTIERVSLLLVDSVKPVRVDTRGGTEVTITGRGFMIPYRRIAGDDGTKAVPKCRIGSVVGPARIKDDTTAFCQTIASSTDGCSSAEIVTLSIDSFAFAYSTEQIQRQETPILRSLNPGSGRFTSPMQITIGGENLIDFGFTRCLYIVLVRNGTAIKAGTYENYTVVGKANPKNAAELICDAAPILDVPWNGQVDVSLDETVWTGNPLPVRYFGAPAGIQMQDTSVVITSAPITGIPTVYIDIVDIVNQVVTANVLPIPVYAEAAIQSFSADSNAADPNAKTILRGTTSKIFELQNYVVNAPATISFSGLFLDAPPSGILILSVRLRPTEQNSVISFDYTTTTRISIQPGGFERISILREPSASIDSNGQLSQEAQISPVDSAGNNLNLNSFEGIILGVAVIERALRIVIALPSSITNAFVAVANRNQSVTCTRGGCDLSALDPINARYGYSYTYYIWEISRPSIFLETTTMFPGCSAGSFRAIGSYSCQTCLANSQCPTDGGMIVDAGYWRASDVALNVYKCFPAEACRGGNFSAAASCAEGYLGPRCAICADNRGKSVTDRCQLCDTWSKITFVFSLIVVTISIICFVIYVVQNWDDPDRHVTTLQLALTQLQLMVAMTDLDFDYPAWYRELQQWVSLFSDLRIFESSNADCALRPEGATFFTRFVTYVCTPILALVIAGIAWVCLYLNPTFFRFSQEDLDSKNKKSAGGSYASSDFKNLNRESIGARLHRRWKRKQLAENKNEAEEIKVALQDLLAGSGEENEDEIENEKIMAVLNGSHAHRELKNPPLPRTGITFLMLIAQQVILFFMYPSTIQYSLSMQNCLTVDDGAGNVISYLKIDPTISCNTSTYQFFRAFSLIFGMGMLFGVPLVYIAAHYIHGRMRPERRRERAQMFSFLMQGVRPRRWYYPALIFLRKGVSTAIASYFTVPLDGYFTMWGLVMYLPMVYFLQPYLRWHHNMLEGMAVSATIVSINLSLIIYAIPNNETVRTATSAIIVILLSCVLLVFAIISTQETRFILWGRMRAYFGHITESEDDDETEIGGKEAAKKAAAAVDDATSVADINLAKKKANQNADEATGTGKAKLTLLSRQQEKNREKAESDHRNKAISRSIADGSSAHSHDSTAATPFLRRRDGGVSGDITIEDIEGEEDDVDHFAIAVADAARAVQLDKIKREKRAQIKQKLINEGRLAAYDENELELVDATGPESSMMLAQLQRQNQHQTTGSGTVSNKNNWKNDWISKETAGDETKNKNNGSSLSPRRKNRNNNNDDDDSVTSVAVPDENEFDEEFLKSLPFAEYKKVIANPAKYITNENRKKKPVSTSPDRDEGDDDDYYQQNNRNKNGQINHNSPKNKSSATRNNNNNISKNRSSLDDDWDKEYFKDQYALQDKDNNNNNNKNKSKKPSAESFDDNDDNDVIPEEEFEENAPPSYDQPGSMGRKMNTVPAIREAAVREEVAKASAAAIAREQRLALTHIGDNDEVVRFQRKRPELIDFKLRDAKIKRDLEERRHMRRILAEEQKKKQLEGSRYIYVPQISTPGASAVDSLSPSQRLEVLRSPHVHVEDLMLLANKNQNEEITSRLHQQNKNNTVPLVPNSNDNNKNGANNFSPAAPRSKTAPSVQQLSRSTDLSKNALAVATMKDDNAQKVLEKCFEPNFEITTRNLEKMMKEIEKKNQP